MGMMRALTCSVAVCLLLACGDDQPSEVATDAAADAAADAATNPAEPAAVDILRACDAPMPCGPSSAHVTEGLASIVRENFECLLSGLAAPTPGRYQHSTHDANGFSSTGIDYVLIVSSDGSVRYGESGSYSSATAPDVVRTFQPGKSCVLKPASYFEACLLALDSFATDPRSAAWQCAFGDLESAWLEQCDEPPLLSCDSQ